LVLPTDQEPPPTATDTLLLVEPSTAKAQRQCEIDNLGDVETPDGHEQEGGPSPQPDVQPRPGPAQDPLFRSADTRYSALRPDFSKVDTEVPQNLAAKAGGGTPIRIEIEAHAREGFDNSRIRTVSENTTTPKFNQSSFEPD
jgi:hypothetical protein